MKNELAITYTGRQFINPELTKRTNAIAQSCYEYATNQRKTLQTIAVHMAIIAKEEAYKSDGYASLSDYAADVFGTNSNGKPVFGKAFVYSLAAAGRRYMELPELPELLKATNGEASEHGILDFSVSQLQECAKLSNSEFVEAVANNDITPDMTTAEIREAVTALKPNNRAEKAKATREAKAEEKAKAEAKKLYIFTSNYGLGSLDKVTTMPEFNDTYTESVAFTFQDNNYIMVNHDGNHVLFEVKPYEKEEPEAE